ncbi:MAG: hypothetical protein ACKO9T_02305 [Nitrospira sp.]
MVVEFFKTNQALKWPSASQPRKPHGSFANLEALVISMELRREKSPSARSTNLLGTDGLRRFSHAVGRHFEIGRFHGPPRFPLSRQRRERLGFFAPVDLRVDPPRAGVWRRRIAGLRSLGTIHDAP